jgi:hypothetical protein
VVDINLKVFPDVRPIQIEGTINGVGVYYRARLGRWELYSGGVQYDESGQPKALGTAYVDGGCCADDDEDDVSTALDRIFENWPAWGLEEEY